jgi:hypothetical protein
MRLALLCVALAMFATTPAFAGKRVIRGNHGPVTVTSPYTGVINKGNINGGAATGLTVTGTAAQSVTNKGTITGSTGLSVSGSGSSSITNTGTISGISTGGSSTRAVASAWGRKPEDKPFITGQLETGNRPRI